MHKVLFFDIDGTLTGINHHISKRVKEAIKKVRDNGNYAFICTGRNFKGIDDLYDDFDGAVCSAGGYVRIGENVLYKEYIDDEELKDVRQIFDQHHIFYTLEATHNSYQDQTMMEGFMALHQGKMNSEMQRMAHDMKTRYGIRSIDEFDQQPVGVHKLSFMAQKHEDVEEVKKLLGDRYDFVIHDMFAGNGLVNGEIIKKTFNKATGMQHVLDYLHLSQEETIAFGDSMNDYEMIRFAHYSVVMDNGSQELKTYASKICESVDDDGVYHELKRMDYYK